MDVNRNSKATSHENGASSGSGAGASEEAQLSSAYATLLNQYREALARIHVLEMENHNLANMVKWSPPPILAQDGNASSEVSEPTELVARIEAVGSLLAKSIPDGPGPAASDNKNPGTESRGEIAQLRIQVQSLLGQLSVVNGPQAPMKGGRPRTRGGRGWRRWSFNRRSWLYRTLNR